MVCIRLRLQWLQAERRLPRLPARKRRERPLRVESDLPCWDATGGAHGPLSALYGAADDQDDLHFLGKDIELWHIDVRERKRAAVLSAEGEWRAPVTDACEALVRWGSGDS